MIPPHSYNTEKKNREIQRRNDMSSEYIPDEEEGDNSSMLEDSLDHT